MKMKKIILVLTIVLSGIAIQAQTDLEIANAIIGKPASDIEKLLDELELEYYITLENEYVITVYIAKNNSVRLWELKHKDLYRTVLVENIARDALAGKDLIVEIFVRYRHDNLNDLREFNAYEAPESSTYRMYDKSGGDKVSHLKVMQF